MAILSELQKTAAKPFFDCRLLNRFRPIKESLSLFARCFCNMLWPDRSGLLSLSRHKPLVFCEEPVCSPLYASSLEYEFEALCERAISLALSIASIHSCAAAEVAEPSDDADFGSSNVKCFSRYMRF